MIENPRALWYNNARCTRRCGGIGRRKGLKIPRWKQRTGSSPVTGTKKEQRFLPLLLLISTGLEPLGRSVKKTVLWTVFSDGSCGSSSE